MEFRSFFSVVVEFVSENLGFFGGPVLHRWWSGFRKLLTFNKLLIEQLEFLGGPCEWKNENVTTLWHEINIASIISLFVARKEVKTSCNQTLELVLPAFTYTR